MKKIKLKIIIIIIIIMNIIKSELYPSGSNPGGENNLKEITIIANRGDSSSK
jgi:PDZ domain-containing secreted protein